MARGLLVSYAGIPGATSSLFPNSGLASLAGVLLEGGHEVKVLDFNTVRTLEQLVPAEITSALSELLPQVSDTPDRELLDAFRQINEQLEQNLNLVAQQIADRIAEEVERVRLDFVGFTLWSGDGFRASAEIASRLKEQFPHLPIYGGGPAVLYSEHTVYDLAPSFDVLVDGEGELALRGLADHIDGRVELADVPNLILRDGSSVRRTARTWVTDLDALPLPVYDPEIYPSLKGDDQIKVFVLDESRGCPTCCAFCIHPEASGRKWRIKSPDRVLREIESISATWGSCAFRFGGSYTPASFYRGFSGALGTDSNIRYCGFAHLHGLSAEEFFRIHGSGCRAFFLGIESFFKPDSQRLGKPITPRRARAAVEACIEAGIVPVVAIIHPIPGQTPQGVNCNRKTLVELCAGRATTVMVTFPGLIPRTSWWAERQRFGFDLQVSEDSYRRLLAQYKIRYILPPGLWQPLPYSLDGQGFEWYVGQSMQLQRFLSESGVKVNIPDETVLLADIMCQEFMDLQRRIQKCFLTSDARGIADMVVEMNKAIVGKAELSKDVS